MVRRIWSLVVKEFLHLIHDWWLPAFMLIGGAVELLLVGWATSRPITNLPLVVLDHDRTAASRTVVATLENLDTFAFAGYAADLSEIQAALDRGDITAAVIIPPDYGNRLNRCCTSGSAGVERPPELGIWVDGSDSVSASAAVRAAEGAIRDIGQGVALRRAGIRQEDLAGFDASLRVWFNETLSEALYTTPAELGLMLEFTVLIFAALSFARERELGTLEQLLVMPYTSLEIIIGKSIPTAVVGFTDFWVLLGIVHLAFGVPVRGSLSLLLALVVIYVLVELSKGLLISVMARNQHQAFLMVMMVGMVDFMFTGYAAPVESMPQVLQWVAQLIPAHHWLTILRALLLKGAGLDVLWPNVLALIGLGLGIGAVSLRYVRRALD